MKYLITETQMNKILPPMIRRRINDLDDSVFEMLYNTSIEVDDFERKDYIDYIIELLFDAYFLGWAENASRKDIIEYFKYLENMFGEKIGNYWDSNVSGEFDDVMSPV